MSLKDFILGNANGFYSNARRFFQLREGPGSGRVKYTVGRTVEHFLSRNNFQQSFVMTRFFNQGSCTVCNGTGLCHSDAILQVSHMTT